ncbi:MAG: alpha/beta fold hydrolase [Chloroflexota bacterium]
MKKRLRGVKRQDIQLDFDLYRVNVPIPGIAHTNLSVLDLWPENAEHTIMFLHGFAGVLESWEFQINFFEQQSYRVVAPDLRGHGQSDAPFTNYTMDEMVTDLHAIVEQLDLPEKFVLVAHSFGGAIATEYAIAYPERLDKLILIATAGEYPLPWFIRPLLRLPTTWLQPLWRFRPRWDAELHVFKRVLVNNLMKWKGWDQLRQISTQTLVVTGERDNIFPREVFDDVGHTIPSAEIYDVGSAKHKVQLERHDAVNRVIYRFVSGDQTQSWRQPDRSAETNLMAQRPWLRNYDQAVPQTVPVPKRSINHFLESTASWLPKRTALYYFGFKLSYQELYDQVRRTAAGFHGMGVQPGDRILIVLPNMPEMVFALYAAMRIRAVPVLPNPDADRYRILTQIRETRPKLLITLKGFGVMAEFLKEEGGLDHFLFAELKQYIGMNRYRKMRVMWNMTADFEGDYSAAESLGLDFNQFLQDISPTLEPQLPNQHDHSNDEIAAILYTSGTTGQPKGVCLTHYNLVANTLQTRHWATNLNYGEEVCLAAVPFVHSYGLMSALLVPVTLGATIVMLPIFETQAALEAIRDHQVTLFPGSPAMYAAINQAPNVREYGLKSIKACVSGSEPLPVEIQEAFEKLTQGYLVEGYGLTEASPVSHINPLAGRRKSGSIGLPIPNSEAKVVDLQTGEDCPSGQYGELYIRGPQVSAGYWVDATTPPVTDHITSDGWLKTGDVAIYDQDGYFHLISRKKHLIWKDEDVIFPRDIEEVLFENNKVLDAAVIGVAETGTNGEASTLIKALIVPRRGQEITTDELRALCQRRLPENAVPKIFAFEESLPRSLVGKLLREKLQ